MSLSKRFAKAGATLAVLGGLTFTANSVTAEASTWVARTVEQVRQDVSNLEEGQAYTIQYGDTLNVISEAIGIPTNKLAQIYNIENIDFIQTGQNIYVNYEGSVVALEDENHEVVSYDVTGEQVEEITASEEASQAVETETAVVEEPAVEETVVEEPQVFEETVVEETQVVEEPVEEPQAFQAEEQVVQTSSNNQPAPAEQAPAPAQQPAAQPAPQPAAPAPVASSSALSAGSSVIGAPYSYGGTTPGGFDCSGFVQWAFAQTGRSIPRTTGTQMAAATPVSNPQPGDLVFFGYGAPTHVGIYAGNGQFLGAQTSTGVAYASVHSGYWGARFLGYGRI